MNNALYPHQQLHDISQSSHQEYRTDGVEVTTIHNGQWFGWDLDEALHLHHIWNQIATVSEFDRRADTARQWS